MKGKKFGILKYPTFREHFNKRRYEHHVGSEKEYEEVIINTLAKGEVFYLKDNAGREYLIFFEPVARWVVIVRDFKTITTAFVLYDVFPTIEDYLSHKGFYRYINMNDEASKEFYSAIVERIRSSLKVL